MEGWGHGGAPPGRQWAPGWRVGRKPRSGGDTGRLQGEGVHCDVEPRVIPAACGCVMALHSPSTQVAHGEARVRPKLRVCQGGGLQSLAVWTWCSPAFSRPRAQNGESRGPRPPAAAGGTAGRPADGPSLPCLPRPGRGEIITLPVLLGSHNPPQKGWLGPPSLAQPRTRACVLLEPDRHWAWADTPDGVCPWAGPAPAVCAQGPWHCSLGTLLPDLPSAARPRPAGAGRAPEV